MSDSEELEKLKKTFEEFIKTSSQLQYSYERLKEESQQLSLYLSNILENLNAAIMVFNNDLSLTLWNGETRRYFPALIGMQPPVQLNRLTPPSSHPVIEIEGILQSREKLTELEAEIEGSWKWLEINASDFLDANQQKIGYLVVINDKTLLRKLQLKSQQEDRLRVMGELAAEVAHEIRNPLGSIELMVTLLQDDLQEDNHHRDLLSRIRTSVDNMNHTVTNILLYTKEIQPERTAFSLAELITQAENIAMNTIVKKQITLEKHLEEISFEADFELLKQCVANILINAAQAVDQGGRIEIHTREVNNGLALTIKDNGCGIPEEMRDKIFKPFFTTKTTGTGLGLAMVKRVIEAHAGKIDFDSDTTGTRFIIQLPL
jgi:signal transduction histidine kinase